MLSYLNFETELTTIFSSYNFLSFLPTKQLLFQSPVPALGLFAYLYHDLEKAMAPHSSTFAWKIPWMEEPGRLQSMGSLRVGHDSATSLSLFHFHALEKEMATHSSVLAWRIPGAGEPGGRTSMGSHRVGHDWSDLAVAVSWFSNWTTNTVLSPIGRVGGSLGPQKLPLVNI